MGNLLECLEVLRSVRTKTLFLNVVAYAIFPGIMAVGVSLGASNLLPSIGRQQDCHTPFLPLPAKHIPFCFVSLTVPVTIM